MTSEIGVWTADPRGITNPERIRELMLDNLFAVFNVRDPERRMEAITRNYTEDVIWTEPDRTNEGREAINARATELLDGLPGFVFTAAGPVHVSRGLGLLAFQNGRAGGIACGERHRRGPGARRKDRRVAHALDRFQLSVR